LIELAAYMFNVDKREGIMYFMIPS